ncbi:sugar phosphate isomerase/epimerase family protein [Streptomyces fumanus]|uniref:Xylose isomerase-like TIM barrel domain-containing protein n=1 Tax=Streptomyces fumanus TaxID=67302 RepID=A0A919E8F1_9ACTN|nr:sugar phosphate isomerase/epimerase family protein [Streptomyces fumanus]GHF24339.1 hypothetical protein GCM10018772_57560 [Streptomyces fumanus]
MSGQVTDTARPRVGVTGWRLPAGGAEAVRLAARAGADGVQLDLGGPGRGAPLDGPAATEAVREAVAATGVELLALTANTLNDIGLTAAPGSADAAHARAVLVRLLDTARLLGVAQVFVPSFRRSAIDTPADLARTAAVLGWAAREAEARGLLLASENALPADRALELVDRVGSPAFRLLLDTYNLRAAGLDAARWTEATGLHLADQVHLKDGVDGRPGPPLGAGDGRLEEVLAAYARTGPRPRALVLENDYRDGDPGPLDADLAWARRAADRLAARPTRPVKVPR